MDIKVIRHHEAMSMESNYIVLMLAFVAPLVASVFFTGLPYTLSVLPMNFVVHSVLSYDFVVSQILPYPYSRIEIRQKHTTK